MKKLPSQLFCFLVFFLVLLGHSVHGAPQQLRFVGYYEGPTRVELENLIADFNRAHPDIVVTYEYVPFHNLKRQLLIAETLNELPDITIIDNPDNAAFAAKGVFADITDLVKQWSGYGKFYPGPWNSTFYKSRQYGIPFTSNCLALFYDKALLERYGIGVPETWEELRSAALKLSDDDRYGIVISAVNTEEGTFQFLPWYLSAGGDLENIGSESSTRAVKFLRTLITDGAMSPEVVSWTMGDIQKQFSAGKAAMMINGPWIFSSIERDSPDLNYGLSKVPKDRYFASVLGGENVAIIDNEHVADSWLFLQYLVSKETISRYALATGYLPPRKDVMSQDERWNTDPSLRVFLEQMKYARPRGPYPRWPELSNLLSNAFQKVLSGFNTPAEAMEDVQQQWSHILQSP
jgi:multiple sugar transport system substrate-binding protein